VKVGNIGITLYCV